MVEQHQPKTALGQTLRARMSDRRWQREVKIALARAAVIEAVENERKASGLWWRRSLAAGAPGVN